MNIFIRLSGDLPSIQKSFFRNSVALLFSLCFIVKDKVPLRIIPGTLRYLLIRAVCGTFAILANFYAVDHLVLADASMLNKMSPFFAVIFSCLLLKEKVSFLQGGSVVLAFLGSMLVVKPTFSNLDIGASLFGLAGGMLAGLAYTTVRVMGHKGVKGSFIVGFFSLFSTLVALPFFVLDYHPMSGRQLLYLIFAGAFAASGQFGITAAYSYAPAREISVYDYSQILFSAIIGFFFFNQKPDIYSWVGYFVICSTAVGMFVYDNRKIQQNHYESL
jgi:drug/metabolite transporter (DMT)-like permease